MTSSIATSRQSDPVGSLDTVRLTPAKAGLKSDRVGLRISQVMKDAVIRFYGSVKAAAISLDRDPSLMMREFDQGKFARFDEKADENAKAFVATAMHETFGAADPQARVRQLIRDGRRILDELAAAVGE